MSVLLMERVPYQVHFYLFSDAHVEVVEVAVAPVGLPGVLTAVRVLAEDGDGVECVGLPVIVTHA